MFRTVFFIAMVVLMSACNDSSKIPPPPGEPCEGINLSSLPIITHGFSEKDYVNVKIRTFVKNSAFDSLVNEFTIPLAEVTDDERIERYIRLPEDLTTNFDWKFIFSDSLSYEISEMKTEWVPRFCQAFCGYECTLSSFKLNGKSDEGMGNIFFKEPDFEYPWEK